MGTACQAYGEIGKVETLDYSDVRYALERLHDLPHVPNSLNLRDRKALQEALFPVGVTYTRNRKEVHLDPVNRSILIELRGVMEGGK